MSLSYVSAPKVHIGQCILFNSFFPPYQRLVVENATKFYWTHPLLSPSPMGVSPSPSPYGMRPSPSPSPAT